MVRSARLLLENYSGACVTDLNWLVIGKTGMFFTRNIHSKMQIYNQNASEVTGKRTTMKQL